MLLLILSGDESHLTKLNYVFPLNDDAEDTSLKLEDLFTT